MTQIDTTNPGKKLWQDMSDAEQGALLLSHHRGEVIEFYSPSRESWAAVEDPKWNERYAYRTKSKPQRETVTLFGNSKLWAWGGCREPKDTHRISFETIDGVPDCDSVRMRPLK